ncbi:hypothetical protein ZEAMMB73_Zm00001d019350 [Zea mays]|uniref:Uncharacterized protein n=1 Tax=Zea mays TaxID=4577 RepID=A0A1D6HX29_MAIZE|nr:hypothetical protein ZEAMMB73_Zm00001d019350 [Zea mays]
MPVCLCLKRRIHKLYTAMSLNGLYSPPFQIVKHFSRCSLVGYYMHITPSILFYLSRFSSKMN